MRGKVIVTWKQDEYGQADAQFARGEQGRGQRRDANLAAATPAAAFDPHGPAQDQFGGDSPKRAIGQPDSLVLVGLAGADRPDGS